MFCEYNKIFVMATKENQVSPGEEHAVTVLCVFALLGHGEPEDLHGHDAEDRCQSALQTVYFPHTTKHEVKSFSSVHAEMCRCS